MLDTIKNQSFKPTKSHIFWADDMFQNHYSMFYENLTAKQLDAEFSKDLKTLVKALSKLPESERKVFIDTLSKMIEFYIENKVEKELDFSFHKILSF